MHITLARPINGLNIKIKIIIFLHQLNKNVAKTYTRRETNLSCKYASTLYKQLNSVV